jgi:hypothetical protein
MDDRYTRALLAWALLVGAALLTAVLLWLLVVGLVTVFG